MHHLNVRKEISPPGNAHEIAQAQLVRFRRRLGPLSRDQELQIENLLISTATKVSLMTGRLMESLDRYFPSVTVAAMESSHTGDDTATSCVPPGVSQDFVK